MGWSKSFEAPRCQLFASFRRRRIRWGCRIGEVAGAAVTRPHLFKRYGLLSKGIPGIPFKLYNISWIWKLMKWFTQTRFYELYIYTISTASPDWTTHQQYDVWYLVIQIILLKEDAASSGILISDVIASFAPTLVGRRGLLQNEWPSKKSVFFLRSIHLAHGIFWNRVANKFYGWFFSTRFGIHGRHGVTLGCSPVPYSEEGSLIYLHFQLAL